MGGVRVIRMLAGMVALRAGVDTGGTFTDAVSLVEGGWKVCKVATTPRKPARAVLQALRNLLPGDGGPLELVHGTTHATNALLTGRLGRTVLVTTRGFADVLAIGRQDRPVLYDLEPRPRRPFPPRARIVEAGERMGPDGKAIQALSREEIARVVAAVERLRPQAVAVACLHADRFPRHEERLGRALRRLGVPVILSSRIAPEYREFERFSTAWADAGLCPVTGPALTALDAALRRAWGPDSRLRILRSDGGTCDAASAAEHPVHLLLSGPAGGLSAARTLADARGDREVLTLDMGGTSTDVSLLGAGELPLLPLELGGLSFLCRALPLHSVGTGGGSLARWDAGGALAVGPESAGAAPGPACYGRGGERATVTDAHLLAGRLHPGSFLGGAFRLDVEAARGALVRLGRAARCGAEEMAAAILEGATAGMERAVRRVSLARGHDPRRFTLYAFGGAGGLHAAWLAGRLGFRAVVIPPHPGAFSALGLLQAPPRRTLARSVLIPLPGPGKRRELFRPLLQRARGELEAEGVPRRRMRVRLTLELRGEGQAGEIALPEGPKAAARFHAAHRARFGYAREDRPILLVAVRVSVDGPARGNWPAVPRSRKPVRPFDAAPALLPEGGGRCRLPWYRREELGAGARIAGPAGIAEYSGTTLVPAGWRARVDAFGALELRCRP